MDTDRMLQYRDEYYKDCKVLIENNHPYKNHVNKFIAYLSLPEIHLANTPRDINKDTVKRCIGYYHEKGEINSRKTMESHLESIKNFYDYLSRTGKWPDIFSDMDYGEFKDDIVKTYNLSEPMERGILEWSEIERILVSLDSAIDYKINFNSPAKRKVITSIKRSDIGENYKTVNINGIVINIPCGLSRDLCSAIKYGEKKNGKRIKGDWRRHVMQKIGRRSTRKI